MEKLEETVSMQTGLKIIIYDYYVGSFVWSCSEDRRFEGIRR